ncbi:MAG: PAS domain S-box protein, partial [Candidatus Eremiobacteraeota bacterium]|nr:PAS domain S-box protein [Candidatus Eremiobacteraeota bacterium]
MKAAKGVMRAEERSMASVLTAKAPRTQRQWAIYTTLAMVLATILVAPFARTPAVPVAWFIGFVVWGAVFTSIGAAYMLSRHLFASRIGALGILVAAYVMSAVFLAGYRVTFASTAGALLWSGWHVLFPGAVAAYVFARRRSPLLDAGSAACRKLLVPFLTAAGALAAAAAVTVLSARFPTLAREAGAVAAPLALAVTFVALYGGWRRTRGASTVHLWLLVSLFALFLDVSLTMYARHAYTWGWYLASIYGLLGASYVFLALMEEAGRMSTSAVEVERKLHVVFDSVADAILTIDARDVIASCNHAAAMLFDISEERLVRLPVSRIIPDYVSALESLPNLGTIEVRGRRSDGSIFPLEIAASQAVEQATMTIVIARDITVRKRAEAALASARDQALEAARLKAQFLATMSHEIRTPINAIVGTSELLLSTPMSEEQREYANTVNTSAESLLAVINDILDFSKLEAGKMELDTVPF